MSRALKTLLAILATLVTFVLLVAPGLRAGCEPISPAICPNQQLEPCATNSGCHQQPKETESNPACTACWTNCCAVVPADTGLPWAPPRPAARLQLAPEVGPQLTYPPLLTPPRESDATAQWISQPHL